MRVPAPQLPQVDAAPLPGVRQDVNFNNGQAALGQGLQQLGEGQRIAFEKAVTAHATDRENQFSSAAIDIEHGTADGKQPGFFQAKGQDALAQSVPAIQALQKKQQDLAEGLSAPAKAIYLARTNALMAEHRRAIEAYTASQAEVLNRATAEARTDTAARTAALNYADDTLVGKEQAAAESAVAAQLHGMPQEVVDSATAGVRQKVAVARVAAALGKQDATTARALLSAHREDLGAQAPQLEHEVSALENALASDSKAKDILQASRPDGYPWMDEAKALAAVDALPPGKLKDETQQRVEHQLAVNRQLKEQAGHEHLNQLQAFYQQSGDPNDARMAPVRAWMMDPQNGAAGLLEQFDRAVRVEQRAARTSDAEERRAQAMADRDAYEEYMAHPVEDRVKLNVDHEYLGTASKLGRDRIRAQQQRDVQTVQKGQQEGEAEFAQDVRNQARLAGLDNGKPISSQPGLQKLMGSLGAWRQQYLLDHGKPPTRQDVRAKLVDALTVGDPGFFHADKFRFQYDAGEDFKRAPDAKQKSPLVTEAGAAPAPAAPTQVSPPPPAKQQMSEQDTAAVEWFRAHRDDPRAKQLEVVLRGKGLL